MNRRIFLPVLIFSCFLSGALSILAIESTKILLGSWSGRATGPQGGPPTGDIVVTFKGTVSAMNGKIAVTAPDGAQYSGQISNISLKNKMFSATAVFVFGENQLETRVSGSLRGRTIQGEFSVISKGQKLGQGTFSITKGAAVAPAK